MFQSLNRPAAVGIWCAMLLSVAGAAALAGVPMTAAAGSLWISACVVPPAIFLLMWRGAAPQTVAEVLRAVDRHA